MRKHGFLFRVSVIFQVAARVILVFLGAAISHICTVFFVIDYIFHQT